MAQARAVANMRVAVIVENKNGQLLGLTSDECLRIGKDGVYEMELPADILAVSGNLKVRIIVDEKAEPLAARVGALPWPAGHSGVQP